MMERDYDYIIAGSGCAGLSLLVRMIKSGAFTSKRILLVDQSSKTENDRTWCFWEKGEGFFQQAVSKSWDKLWFRSSAVARLMDINPYQYKLIRGIDLYVHALQIIGGAGNVEVLNARIDTVGEDQNGPFIILSDRVIRASVVFNSILFHKPALKQQEFYLLQHFKGWFIETSKEHFNPGEATLMDFRTSQQYGTSFVYVMPFSKTTALIEYTLFTHELLADAAYDEALGDYIGGTLGITDYMVSERETGVIPMTNHRFPIGTPGVVNIGTAGGQTRGSSGYTFQFIQQHSELIVERLLQGKSPLVPVPLGSRRFNFYDSVLLDILHHAALPGETVFSDLFRKNDPGIVLRFLDKKSNLAEELKVIASLPTMPFLKAALRHLI